MNVLIGFMIAVGAIAILVGIVVGFVVYTMYNKRISERVKPEARARIEAARGGAFRSDEEWEKFFAKNRRKSLWLTIGLLAGGIALIVASALI